MGVGEISYSIVFAKKKEKNICETVKGENGKGKQNLMAS